MTLYYNTWQRKSVPDAKLFHNGYAFHFPNLIFYLLNCHISLDAHKKIYFNTNITVSTYISGVILLVFPVRIWSIV